MKNLGISALILGILTGIFVGHANAQPDIRQEDHFYRRRVVVRVDLGEKMNQPLVQRESTVYPDHEQIQKQGLIGALVKGLEEGHFDAYHPDDYSSPMNYEEVMARMQAFDFVPTEDIDEIPTDDLDPDPDFDEEWIDAEWEVDPFVSEEPTEGGGYGEDLASYEQVVQFVEDRIFDKNRGEMVYRYDYIQLIWSDPGETLPEKELCIFKYDEVKDLLDEVICYNRFNDAERRTMKEVLELRQFHSYIINVSGNGVHSLAEAEFRRQQLVEFEHHLWHY